MTYSNRDLTGFNLSTENMDGMTIENSCLSDATLPPTLTGATFIDCNMDNVIVPEGNTMIRCSNRTIRLQNDGDDWVCDPVTLEPIEPVNKKSREMQGLNIDPALIPEEPQNESI